MNTTYQDRTNERSNRIDFDVETDNERLNITLWGDVQTDTLTVTWPQDRRNNNIDFRVLHVETHTITRINNVPGKSYTFMDPSATGTHRIQDRARFRIWGRAIELIVTTSGLPHPAEVEDPETMLASLRLPRIIGAITEYAVADNTVVPSANFVAEELSSEPTTPPNQTDAGPQSSAGAQQLVFESAETLMRELKG